MSKREWPLILFTLWIQMAVGSTFVLASVFFIDHLSLPGEVMDSLSFTLLLIVPSLLILGVLSAILHLGRPAKAKLALANLKHSWLSREALLGVSFGVVTLLLCLLQIFGIGPPALSMVLLLVGVICGFGLLFGMSRIYMLRTVPTWNTWATPISFFLSALLLGVLLLSVTTSYIYTTIHEPGLFRGQLKELFSWMGWASAILLSTQLLVSFTRDRYILWRGRTTRDSIKSTKSRHSSLRLLRTLLGVLAISLCMLFALQPLSNSGSSLLVETLLAFLLVLTSEILGRFLFYASFKRSGL